MTRWSSFRSAIGYVDQPASHSSCLPVPAPLILLLCVRECV